MVRSFLIALASALPLAALPAVADAPPLTGNPLGNPLPRIGADLDPASLTPETQSAELARLAEIGVTSIRLFLDWNRVEPQPGNFTWAAYDSLVDTALAQGLDVVLVLGPCAEWAVDPAWNVPPDQRAYSIPRSLDLWERYVSRAVSHFRTRVHSWQVRRHPNVHYFRGARSEYHRLLRSAAHQIRTLDPHALIIVPEPGSLGLATLDQLLHSPASEHCDILGLYLPAKERSLSDAALAWAVLAHEVLAAPDPPHRQPIWILGPDAPAPEAHLLAHYLLAAAFGADRCYLPADALRADWLRPLSNLRYLGFLHLGPELWALAFEDAAGSVVAAWTTDECEVLAGSEALAAAIAPPSDLDLVRQAALLGDPAGAAIVSRPGDASPGDPITLRLGPRPALIRGLAADAASPGAPTRRDVLSARPGPDLQRLPLAYADYSMDLLPEFGLYNRPLRDHPGGAISEELRVDRPCLRTHMTSRKGQEDLDNPYLYFDVDDTWLYFDRAETPVAITVECEGSFRGRKKLGFNIMYDATTGYRFTPWQWVDPGYGWRRCRIELDDVSFANRDGYDFRINVKGSKQDLWVAAVTIEKLPPPSP